jgi:hypothetical protein
METLPRLAVIVLALACARAAGAQSLPPSETKSETPPIQDNSFLMEEAYNQEEGVVQHINAFQRMRGGDWVATFTQEYPVPRQAHQLSYTIAYQRVEGDAAARSGLGDIALNYRYQLAGSGEAKFACAPRVTLLLPTGDEKDGLGSGGAGVQANVAASTVLSSRFVTHTNAGATYTWSAKNARGDKARERGYNAGQSLVWLARSDFNVLVEAVWSRQQEVVGPGRVRGFDSFFISPGVRWAYNFPTGLQVVPGVALPIGAGPSRRERSVFLYLSFEHPMWKATQ